MAGRAAGQARGARKAEDTESGGSSSSFLGIVRPGGAVTAGPRGAAPGSGSDGGGREASAAKAPRKPTRQAGERGRVSRPPTSLYQRPLAEESGATREQSNLRGHRPLWESERRS